MTRSSVVAEVTARRTDSTGRRSDNDVATLMQRCALRHAVTTLTRAQMQLSIKSKEGETR